MAGDAPSSYVTGSDKKLYTPSTLLICMYHLTKLQNISCMFKLQPVCDAPERSNTSS